MAGNIAFLKDSDNDFESFYKALEKEGFFVMAPESEQEVYTLIENGQLDLVIHATSEAEDHWGLCEKLQAELPRFPIIHLLEKGTCRGHTRSKGNFRASFGKHGKVTSFIKQVKRLITMGQLDKESHVVKAELALIDEISLTDLKKSKSKTIRLTGAFNKLARRKTSSAFTKSPPLL